MRGRKWTWAEKILLATPPLFVSMALVTVLAPRDAVFRSDILRSNFQFGARESDCGRGNSCQNHLKQIGLGMLQYAQDYNGKLPLAASTGAARGWVDAIFPYVKSTQIFQCPSAPFVIPISPQFVIHSSYYLNRRLSGQSNVAAAPERLILAGEGDDGIDLADTRYAKSDLPARWKTDAKSPLFRHLTDEVWAKGGSYFLSLDGRVKRLRPDEIGSGDTNSSVMHFAPR